MWANIHASFFFAPLIALVYMLARGAGARWFLWAALVSALAPLANPYGWHLYAHVFRYLTDSELLARIGEFQSFDFHAAGSWPIIVTLLVAVAGGTLALLGRPPRAFRAGHADLRHGVALRPRLAAGGLAAAAAGQCGDHRYSAAGRGGGWFSSLLRPPTCHRCPLLWSRTCAPGACSPAFALLRLPAIQAATGFPPDQFPVEAYSQVARLPAAACLFAPDKFGGYLIYRSQAARKVFFDGRSDLYGADFLKQYARMVQLRPGWRETGILSTSPTRSSPTTTLSFQP